MLRPAVLTICLGITLSGCAQISESRFNPLNWFGSSTETAAAVPSEVKPLTPERREVVTVDARVLIDQITAFEIARTPEGAILRATGIAATQGFFNAQLVLVARDNSNATYEFRVERPAGFQDVGSAASRQISVATVVTGADLEGVRQITVRGAQSSRTSRR